MSLNKLKHFFLLIELYSCDISPRAKLYRLSFPCSRIYSNCVLSRYTFDTRGQCHTRIYAQHRYLLTIVDDFIRFSWAHVMVTEDEAFALSKSLISMAKTQWKATIRIV